MNYFSRCLLWLALSASAAAQVGNAVRDHVSVSDLVANNTSAVRGTPQNGNADPGNVSKLPIRSLLYRGSTTKIYVRYMPWFGDSKHINVGYSSDDPKQIQRQVEDMMSRGIDGAIVDWYGAEDRFKNHSTELLLAESERRSFTVAISVDKGALKCGKRGDCDKTSELIEAMRYVAEHFGKSSAYVHVDGRPLMTFFGLEKADIDWKRVRREVPGNPLLLFRNSGGFTHDASDGAFSWLAPETVKPGDERGFDYIERFHKTAREHSNEFAMGSAYKGFDDSLASWGKGRRIAQDCGQTWLASFDELNHFYSERHQLPALIIVTWNDYEEGTAIEPGIDDCVRIRADVRGDRIEWDIDGPKDTIDHFEVYESTNGRDATLLKELRANASDVKLADLKLAAGDYTLFVKAVARPSLMNHVSGGVRIHVGR